MLSSNARMLGATSLLLALTTTCTAYTELNKRPEHQRIEPRFERPDTIASRHYGYTGCASACLVLSDQLPGVVSFQNTTGYNTEQSSYWSDNQGEVSPRCFIKPTTAEDVAAIVCEAVKHNCAFAVRSGGHAAFAGASNIQDGITIDLQALNSVQVSEDLLTTYVGAGAHWIDVYDYLTPRNLSVVGGRVSGIGVGGLTLGGGISFFSGRYGWACDGVREYELVSANGTILSVTQASYPDLYWALRGGGNNFGIVAKFHLETFKQGPMWGGAIVSTVASNQTSLQALADFAYNAPQDVDAAVYVAFAYVASFGIYITSTFATYAKPVANPPILQNFTNNATIPQLTSSLRYTNMTDLARELNASNPDGFRETYWTATFKFSMPMLDFLLNTFVEEIDPTRNVSGILPSLTLQPITTAMISHFSKNGGNCLGIEEGDGPLLLINPAIRWDDARDDDKVLGAAQRLTDRSIAFAKSEGLDHRYIYQNYAAKSQDVFAGYGEANHERLKHISRKYDPGQVFQRLEPGYFKL